MNPRTQRPVQYFAKQVSREWRIKSLYGLKRKVAVNEWFTVGRKDC